ncbi:MAG: hypothetical protein LBI39_04695 [Puniceicoccales bacterium]|nr:hypothetical protein [Puniceicoccales bacterium]
MPDYVHSIENPQSVASSTDAKVLANTSSICGAPMKKPSLLEGESLVKIGSAGNGLSNNPAHGAHFRPASNNPYDVNCDLFNFLRMDSKMI